MERDFSPASTCSLEGGELFLDMMSQPSRACAYFAHLCRLPLATRVTALNKKAQLDPSYPNPLRQVPCLRERDGFVLPESSAILKYLAARHGVPDHWYPSEPRARARVDAALDWQHFTIRRGAAGVTWNALVARNMGMNTSPETARAMLGVLRGALQKLETVWLVSGQGPFMAGASEPSLADLLVSEEIFNLVLLEAVDAREFEFLPRSLDDLLGTTHPRTRRFLEACRGLDEPAWTRIHAVLHKARDAMVARRREGEHASSKL